MDLNWYRILDNFGNYYSGTEILEIAPKYNIELFGRGFSSLPLELCGIKKW